ncbi:hypothetical protein BC941DRAFT_410576 [Chlamydoabsidia padenii]|nr:hypothetical protein BC941DRAFT_410576 [Chlamydoabsidia padenii]
MSRYLFGLTKIVNEQSMRVYKESIQLLSKVHREMTCHHQSTIDPSLGKSNKTALFTLKEHPYFMMEGPNRTKKSMIDIDESPLEFVVPHVTIDQIYPSSIVTGTPPPSANIQHGLVESTFDYEEPALMEQPFDNTKHYQDQPGPSRSAPAPFNMSFMDDQMVVPEDHQDYNMTSLDGWISMMEEEQLLMNDASQQVPFISPEFLHRPLFAEDSRHDVDDNGLYGQQNITSLQTPAMMDMDNDDYPDIFYDYPGQSPMTSIRTEDYSRLVLIADSSSQQQAHPRQRRRLRRRQLSDGLQVVPVMDLMDHHSTVVDYARDITQLITTDAVPDHQPQTCKHQIEHYRRIIRQPAITLKPPSLIRFWEQTRVDLSAIEQGRTQLERGRNRDPHSHDEYAFFGDFGDDDNMNDMDNNNPPDPQPSSTNQDPSMVDMYGFDHISLEDDHHSNSTIKRRQEQGWGSDTFAGGSMSSWAADFEPIDPPEDPEEDLNYSELLDMDVQQPTEVTGFEFDQYLGLVTNNEQCIFGDVFPTGAGGSKRSEAALAFYHVLDSASAQRVRPEQDTSYGPIKLHLPIL